MSNLQHRKGTTRIQLKDAQGVPMAGRSVHARLEKHAFLFGCGIFWMNELQDPSTPPEKKALLETLWEAWHEVFNYGTMSFYQGRYEPRENETLEVPTMRAAKFLKANNVTMKGHPLCWHTASAKWLLGRPNADVLANQLHRIQRDVSAFKDYITLWDVINEVVIMPIFEKEDNAITRLCQEIGRVGIIKAVFDQARKTNPDATLLLNDFNTSENYRQLIEDCLAAGVPIDVIGIQSHQHQGFWGMEKLHEVLERFASFGMPMHFTENTFVSGDLMPPHIVDLNDWQVPEWPTHAAGEERQAQNVLTMVDTLFAHPQVEAFTTWDFTDGAWLGAPSGFLRKDGTRKPSFEAIKQRVCRDWHTDVTLMTDENGYVTVDGFRGEYSLECDGRRGAFVIGKEPAGVEITL